MAKALILERNGSLPEKEMMGRLVARLQSALDGGDHEGADAAAWDTLRWAWSLGRAPNVWVAEAHKLLGTLLLHHGQASHARNHFYSAAALLSALTEPGGQEQAALLEGARQLLRKSMMHLGEAEQTDDLVRRANDAFIAAREHCERGSQLVENDPKAAHEEFARALALFPYDPRALFYHGVASISLSNLGAAREDFDKVLALQPQNLTALVNRAVVKTQLKDTDGALADYAAVLKIDPIDITALRNRSLLRSAAGDIKAAIEDLDRLIAAHPDVTGAHALRANCLERLGPDGRT